MDSSLEEFDGDSKQLLLFRRRYFQTEEPSDLTFPSKDILKSPDIQRWIYDTMFKEDEGALLPHPRYKFRVLKELIRILEAAMEDPVEDEISDDLATCLATMLAQGVPNEYDASQDKKKVTYTLPTTEVWPPTIHMWESPSILAEDGETGLRTWQASLFLGTYLSTHGRHLVEGKSIFELAGGLGFISILCAKHLGAKKVLLTDGSPTVVRLAECNTLLNGSQNIVERRILEFGDLEVFDLLEDEDGGRIHYDLLLGADMLYDPQDFPALMLTLQVLFSYLPDLQFLLACTVRSEDTLENFLDVCGRCPFDVQRLDIPKVPEDEQLGFFHDNFHEVRVYSITKSPGKVVIPAVGDEVHHDLAELALKETMEAHEFKQWKNPGGSSSGGASEATSETLSGS
ncbi:MAG: hypothetical protein LQ352_006325 [Teloschistes flavicans]|nr:MAG: hypothetical protein LQ352_006325 [Teloschistes flavicans]